MKNFVNLSLGLACALLIVNNHSASAQSKKMSTGKCAVNTNVKEQRLRTASKRPEVEKDLLVKRDTVFQVSNCLDSLKRCLAKDALLIRKNGLQLDSITEQRFKKALSEEDRNKINELYSKNRAQFVLLYANIKSLKGQISEMEKSKPGVESGLTVQTQHSNVEVQSKEVAFQKPVER